jgi:hypothetical protein
MKPNFRSNILLNDEIKGKKSIIKKQKKQSQLG